MTDFATFSCRVSAPLRMRMFTAHNTSNTEENQNTHTTPKMLTLAGHGITETRWRYWRFCQNANKKRAGLGIARQILNFEQSICLTLFAVLELGHTTRYICRRFKYSFTTSTVMMYVSLPSGNSTAALNDYQIMRGLCVVIKVDIGSI